MEAWFAIKRVGDKYADRAPLSEMLKANRDDEELCEWLRRSAQQGKPGDTLHTGGGAAPRTEVRRIA
jgi:hypothetical protein